MIITSSSPRLGFARKGHEREGGGGDCPHQARWRKKRNESCSVKMNASALMNATSTLRTPPSASTSNAYTSKNTEELLSNKTNTTTSIWETRDTMNQFYSG